MDDAIWINPATDNSLQRGFIAIRDDFSVYFATTFKDAENWCFFVFSSSPFSSNPFSAEVRFIYFDYSLNGRLSFTTFGNAFSNQS
jgi:hypothetical protein